MPKGHKKYHKRPNYHKPVFGTVDEVSNTLKPHKEDLQNSKTYGWSWSSIDL